MNRSMPKRFTGLLVPVLALPMGPSFSVQAGEGTPGRPERDASSAAGRARAGPSTPRVLPTNGYYRTLTRAFKYFTRMNWKRRDRTSDV